MTVDEILATTPGKCHAVAKLCTPPSDVIEHMDFLGFEVIRERIVEGHRVFDAIPRRAPGVSAE